MMDATADGAGHPRHLVLVVGDVGDTEATLLTTKLLEAGFDAIAVESGEATMRLLASGVEPCVVVIDVDLPDMTGWTLRRRLREIDVRMRPATVLASAPESEGTPAGVIPIPAVLEKPAAIEAVIEIIERHCPRRTASAVA